jgi:hypothetical protein
MAKQRRYPKEEFARRGDAIYEQKILPRLKPSDTGKYVAIDIETGEYEISRSKLAACDRLDARLPDAQTWLIKVGSRYVARFGLR